MACQGGCDTVSRRMVSKADRSPPRHMPPVLVAGLVAAIVLDTLLQVVWKQAALTLSGGLSPTGLIAAILHQPLFLVVGVLFVAQMINWLNVLDKADVSFALPITALSYVSVAAASGFILHEAITLPRTAGITLILAGVVLVARSGHDSSPADVA